MGLFRSSSSSSVLSLVRLFVLLFAFAWVCFKAPRLLRYAVSDNELPVSVDWRERGAVVDVKRQGLCGSCWAFSTIAAIEGLHKIQTGQLISLSAQELVDCVNASSNGCNGGLMEDGFEFIIKNGGIDNERHYPYKEKKRKCQRHTKHSKVVSIDGYERVPANDEKALQRAVARQPVIVAVDGSDDDFQHYESGVFTGSCGTKLNHAMVIVGYGTDVNGSMDYWIVKNSWGTEWGENGYIRIQRNFAHINGSGKCGIAMGPLYPTMKSTAPSVRPLVLLLADFISRATAAISNLLMLLLAVEMITIALSAIHSMHHNPDLVLTPGELLEMADPESDQEGHDSQSVRTPPAPFADPIDSWYESFLQSEYSCDSVSIPPGFGNSKHCSIRSLKASIKNHCKNKKSLKHSSVGASKCVEE